MDSRNQVGRLPQVHLANEATKIFTGRGHDWTYRFSPRDAWRIRVSSAVVDGEIAVPAADGTTDFSVPRNELKRKSTSVVLVAFDLLYLDGRDLGSTPPSTQGRLKKIDTDIQFSESFEIDGREMFAARVQARLPRRPIEGAAPIRRDARTIGSRKTCAQRETLTIAGFALDGTTRDGLFVGRRKNDDLVYTGKVDHVFKVSAADLKKRLISPAQHQAHRPQGHRG